MKILIALFITFFSLMVHADGLLLGPNAANPNPHSPGISTGIYYGPNFVGMTISGTNEAVFAYTCVSAPSGFCTSYTSPTVTISAPTNNGICLAANGSPTFCSDQYGHIQLDKAATSLPTLSSCGTSTVVAGGNDHSFQVSITAGTPTACAVTFGNPYAVAPRTCIVSPASSSALSNAMWTAAPTTTGFIINGTAMVGLINAQCF